MGLIRLDDDSEEFLRHIKEALPKNKNGKEASYSDAIKYLHKEHTDIKVIISDHFKALNQVMLVFFHGNIHKAHITEQLRVVLLKAIKNENNYVSVSSRLLEILDEEVD